MPNRRLLGRQRETDRLSKGLDRIESGTSQVVAIEGEPGIGKSRLLDELSGWTHDREWLLLRGAATEFESEVPFGALIDALDPYLRTIDSSLINQLGRDAVSELAEAFPALVSRKDRNRPPGIIGERYRVHRALCDLLDGMAKRNPVVLALDDMQWADQATLEFLGHFLHRPVHNGVMVVFTFRSGQLDALLIDSMIKNSSREGVDHLTLRPLTEGESAALAGVESERAAKALFGTTGGNPFFVLETAKLAPASQMLEILELEHHQIPTSISSAIASELRKLSDETRWFAQCASVVGDPFEISLAAEVSERKPSVVSAAIDELADATIIATEDSTRRLAFRHPLVRAAIYESMLPGARLEAHGRAAEALEQRHATAVERARHLVLAATPGDREAAQVIGYAADKTLLHTPILAMRWYESALELNPGGDTEFKLAMLGGKAAAATAVSRFKEATVALLTCIDLLPEDDEEGRLTLTAACAQLEELSGLHDRSVSRLLASLEQAKPNSQPAIEIMLKLAHGASLRNDHDSMDLWSSKALESTRSHHPDDRDLLAVALATRALSAALSGPTSVAQSCADEAAEIFEAMSNDRVTNNVDGLVRLVGAELYMDRYEQCQEHAALAADVSRASGQGQNFPILFPAAATAATFRGQFELARSILNDSIDAARVSQHKSSLAWSLSNRALLLNYTGDTAGADRDAREAVKLVEDQSHNLVGVLAQSCLATSLFELGNFEQSYQEMLEAGGGEDLAFIPGSSRVNYLTQQVRTLLALDRREDAARIKDLAVARAKEFNHPLARSCAHRAEALVRLAYDDAKPAALSAREALRFAEEAQAPVEAARCRLDLATALSAMGEKEDAIEQLDMAAASFAETGAERYQKRAEQLLRALGKRIHRRTKKGTAALGIDSLTEREREVARLVRERHTNREIAASMFLSQKTVETHLRNIFTKLNVSSRVEVARIIEREE